MKSKPKAGDDQIRAALLDMSVKLLHAIEGLRHALSVPLEPKAAKAAAHTIGKRKGRPPMTEEQRVAAKAERERLLALDAEFAEANEVLMDRPKPAKPQPVTRASLAAQNAAPAETSYFTKVG